MENKILIINSGSSSLKFKILTVNNVILLVGVFDSIGLKNSFVEYKVYNNNFNNNKDKNNDEIIEDHFDIRLKNHCDAFIYLLKIIERIGINKNDIIGIGHRVVHGGNFKEVTEMTKENLIKLKRISFLAPLHNPNSVKGIEQTIELFPNSKIYACFDTVFFKDLPEVSYKYAIKDVPMIRKYGFHGLSYSYIFDYVFKKYNYKNIIMCHIGNGASITAIKKGQVIDTTMGLSPLEGLIMGTRCGDIDPEVVFFLEREKNMTFQEVSDLLNKKSGLLGMCNTNDMRDVWENVKETYKDDLFFKPKNDYDLAYKKYIQSIIKYIAFYKVEIGKVDAIIFSGGIGEKAYYVRESVLRYFDDIEVDDLKNQKNEEVITTKNSPIKAMVVNTDEEQWIFKEVLSKVN